MLEKMHDQAGKVSASVGLLGHVPGMVRVGVFLSDGPILKIVSCEDALAAVTPV